MISKNQLEFFVQKYLTGGRYEHTISTANFMAKVSGEFSIDSDKAFHAGMLHDIAKSMLENKIIQLALAYNKRNIVPISNLDFKLRFPGLLHGPAAAELIITELSIKDRDILDAVVNHTTGGEGLSNLAKLMFAADYCEPLRKHKESKIIRKYLIKNKSLNKAYKESCFYLINHLLSKGTEICPDSILGYNETIRTSLV